MQYKVGDILQIVQFTSSKFPTGWTDELVGSIVQVEFIDESKLSIKAKLFQPTVNYNYVKTSEEGFVLLEKTPLLCLIFDID